MCLHKWPSAWLTPLTPFTHTHVHWVTHVHWLNIVYELLPFTLIEHFFVLFLIKKKNLIIYFNSIRNIYIYIYIHTLFVSLDLYGDLTQVTNRLAGNYTVVYWLINNGLFILFVYLEQSRIMLELMCSKCFLPGWSCFFNQWIHTLYDSSSIHFAVLIHIRDMNCMIKQIID